MSLLFCVLQIIYVSYIHLCCFICSHEFISFVLSYYNILYLIILILQSCCLCCYLFIFSCSIIIHVPCLYAYYIYMIHMLYVLMIHIVMDIFEITISMINYLLYVIIIMLIYGIKMIWKMAIILTETSRWATLPWCIGQSGVLDRTVRQWQHISSFLGLCLIFFDLHL
jgi:hypothetical protein